MMVDRDKIKEQAKSIMDNFIKALDKANLEDAGFKVKRENNIRDENAKLLTNPDFRNRMFDNAPKLKDDCIVAEKKSW